jgi:hypothetical protein
VGSLIGWGSSPDDETKLPPSPTRQSGQAMAGQANDKIQMSQKEVNGEQSFDAGCEK